MHGNTKLSFILDYCSNDEYFYVNLLNVNSVMLIVNFTRFFILTSLNEIPDIYKIKTQMT